MTKRIIDANLNRLREGIRVVEDIARYVYEDASISKRLKSLRHKSQIDVEDLLKHRDILNDPNKETTKSESSRKNLKSIIIANFKRAQEASRVLEEILKLDDTPYSQIFKDIRYELYDIEKNILIDNKFNG